jgi:hypothetical protein
MIKEAASTSKDLPQIVLVENPFDELKRLVPVKSRRCVTHSASRAPIRNE